MNDKRAQRMKNIYALYIGERNVCDGTLSEIHKKTGLSMKYLNWLTFPAAGRREAGSMSDRAKMLVLIDE